MAEAADTADILETLERGADANREPDEARGKPRAAYQWANTRKGYWRTAGSGILNVALSNHYLEALGFPNVIKRYEELRARTQRLRMLHATH
jgi:hypothetical protein